jgi:hypothetical protein
MNEEFRLHASSALMVCTPSFAAAGCKNVRAITAAEDRT